MSSSSQNPLCPKCGCTVDRDAPRGLCARCLLSSILDSGPLVAGPAALPREFGAYTLMEEVARGGMGIVYRARQQPIHRTVALKVLASGQFASPDFVERFRIEADAAASLDHPNIVPVYEAGECEGQPFFSMKLIDGRSLAHRLASLESPMPPRDAAELLVKLARAVHFAHQRGILHRDIKPGNVLIDPQGEPHLTDFGLARLVENDSTLTRTMAMLGTPSYMPPEQARGDTRSLTTAVDVYGLGAILYELLAGQPPFAGGTTMETVRQVLEKDPRRPSLLNPAIDRDLDTICLKCLEKEPARRYASAEALAADLDRWRRHEPIAARQSTTLERTAKWIRRNRGAFAAICTIALLLTVGISATSWLAVRESDARINAENHQKTAEAATKQAEANLTRAEWLVYAGKVMLAQASFEAGNGGLALHHLEQCQPDRRGWEWQHLCSRISPVLTLKRKDVGIWGVAFSPDGKRIVTSGEYGHLTLGDAVTGDQLLARKGHSGVACCLAFGPDGHFFVSGSFDGTAKVWDATGREIRTLSGHRDRVQAVAISPDSKRIVTGGDDHTARLWDAATGDQLLRIESGASDAVRGVAFSPDGSRIATGGVDGIVKVWDAVTGTELLRLKELGVWVRSVAFSPDGERILVGADDATASVWDARTGATLGILKGHKGSVNNAAFSPDGTRIVTSSMDQTVRVWETGNGRELLNIRGHTGGVHRAAFSPDGKRIVTGGMDGTAKLWDALHGQEIPALSCPPDSINCMVFSPDSRHIATGCIDNSIRIYDRVAGQVVLATKMTSSPATGTTALRGVCAVAFSPDGKRFVAGGEDEMARVWDAQTREELIRLNHPAGISCAAFSPDGRHIVTGSGGSIDPVWGGNRQSGEATVWDAATGEKCLALKGHTGLVTSVAFSPDGTRIATGSWDQTAKTWDAATGRELFSLKGHVHLVLSVAFSPDSQRIVTGSIDKDAKVWDASNGREIFTLRHTRCVRGAVFNSDGTRIVTGSDDRTAKIWEAATGLELFATSEHKDSVWNLALSPDGRHLATSTAGSPATIRIWSAPEK